MHGFPWKLSRSSKICQLVWGRLQGKDALLAHFRGTVHLKNTPNEFRPIAIAKDATAITASNGTLVLNFLFTTMGPSLVPNF